MTENRLTAADIRARLASLAAKGRDIARATASLHLATAVGHLRDTFPGAAYAWVDVETPWPTGDPSVTVLRVHDTAGAVLWNTDTGTGADSAAAEALADAVACGQPCIPAHPARHPVAGAPPVTGTGETPGLIAFVDVDRDAAAGWIDALLSDAPAAPAPPRLVDVLAGSAPAAPVGLNWIGVLLSGAPAAPVNPHYRCATADPAPCPTGEHVNPAPTDR